MGSARAAPPRALVAAAWRSRAQLRPFVGCHGGLFAFRRQSSGQHANARIKPAFVTGNDLAFVQDHRTETHDHRSVCARKGLAASRRPSLAV
jgi:hypothetical protein